MRTIKLFVISFTISLPGVVYSESREISYKYCGSFTYNSTLGICSYGLKYSDTDCPSGIFLTLEDCEKTHNVNATHINAVDLCMKKTGGTVGAMNYCLLDFALAKRKLSWCKNLKFLQYYCYEEMGKIDVRLCDEIQDEKLRACCRKGDCGGLPPNLPTPKGGWTEEEKLDFDSFNEKP